MKQYHPRVFVGEVYPEEVGTVYQFVRTDEGMQNRRVDPKLVANYAKLFDKLIGTTIELLQKSTGEYLIIDGQHRLSVVKHVGKPMLFHGLIWPPDTPLDWLLSQVHLGKRQTTRDALEGTQNYSPYKELFAADIAAERPFVFVSNVSRQRCLGLGVLALAIENINHFMVKAETGVFDEVRTTKASQMRSWTDPTYATSDLTKTPPQLGPDFGYEFVHWWMPQVLECHDWKRGTAALLGYHALRCLMLFYLTHRDNLPRASRLLRKNLIHNKDAHNALSEAAKAGGNAPFSIYYKAFYGRINYKKKNKIPVWPKADAIWDKTR